MSEVVVFHKAYIKSAIRILVHLKKNFKNDKFNVDSIEIGNLEPEGVFSWQFKIETNQGTLYTSSRDPAPSDFNPLIARKEIIYLVKLALTFKKN